MQVIDVNKEATKKRPTLLVRSSFLAFLGILRTCADFGVSTDFSRFKGLNRRFSVNCNWDLYSKVSIIASF